METFNQMTYPEQWKYLRNLLRVGLVIHYRAPYLDGNPECDLTITGLTKKQITYTVSDSGKMLTKHPDTFATDLIDGYRGHA